ncbi:MULTISPECIES: helix-turn-helix domain-containing protein [Bacillus cereus group]|uniref:helix-turn-helix domain-containing protein n=1 Tax=Bacillus cereus group TaxID=86661 RepID=UPI0015CFDB03|nr:helix-turn-helix transcriptional regulator [Bacillus sp. FDAARGOS_235]HDR7367929.1 helix-turn-helix transcriptional regulator [Bacillus toyonensis]
MNGNRVKMLRNEKKLTQNDLSEKIGVSKSALSQIENNKITPSRETVSALSRVLEVTSDFILGLSEYRELDQEESSEVRKEMNVLTEKIEKLSAERQKFLIDMMKAIVDKGSTSE